MSVNRSDIWDLVSDILQDFKVQTRVDEAWSVGTMTQDDFHLANEDEDIIDETFSAIESFLINNGIELV